MKVFGGDVDKQAAHHGLDSGKIIFADQLRAVAAVSVMIVHLLGVYWAARDVVARHIFAPLLGGPSARSEAWITNPYFDFGPFGVALFFLISGFVIPFSLARATRWRFLAARTLRIYPTYIVCLSLSLLAIWLSSRFWGVRFDWGISEILHNALLTSSVTGVESIDMVNWSLAIEIKFYLLACLLAPWMRRGRILPLLLVSLVLSLGIAYVAHALPASGNTVNLGIAPVHFNLIAHDLLFMPFMFVGTLFSYRFRGQITRTQLAAATAVLFGIFLASWLNTHLRDYFPRVPLNYFYALVVFTLAYASRKHWRPIKPVDWLASISYPLYALHSLVGYAAIRYLNANGITYYLSLVIAVAIVVVLAWFVHLAVEMPAQEMGRRIMRKHHPAMTGNVERDFEPTPSLRKES